MWQSSDDPLHPLNTMISVEGSRQIPVTVTAVVAFGFVLSALIVNTNPWKTRQAPFLWFLSVLASKGQNK